MELVHGWGRFSGPNCVSVMSQGRELVKREIKGKNFLISVGGRPSRPNIPGAELGWVSDDLFLQKSFPKKIVVVGAGFIACEFSCILNGLGIEVIQLVRGNNLLKDFDSELSSTLNPYLTPSNLARFDDASAIVKI